MQSEAFNSLVAPLQRIRNILWMAFSAAIVLYGGIVYFMFGVRSSFQEAFAHPLALPLALVAIGAAVAARWLPGRIFSEQQAREVLAKDPDPAELARDSSTGNVDENRLAKIRALSDGERRLLTLAQYSVTPFIIQLALQEAIAVFGLVLGFEAQSVLAFIPFGLVALAMNLTVSPKLEPVFEAAMRMH